VLGSSSCGSSPRGTAPLPLAHWPAYNGVYGGFNFNGYGKGQVLVDTPKVGG
jgi:hypothetical protein